MTGETQLTILGVVASGAIIALTMAATVAIYYFLFWPH